MTQKPSSNGSSLPKAPNEKLAFVQFIERRLNLQPDCSVFDLDNPSHIQTLPPLADLGVWLNNWHALVDLLGTQEDAREGVEQARDILFLASCRLSNMVFSTDATKPPLDQFGPPGRGLKLLFESSTCYTLVEPVALYRGRVVYWGSNPAVRWTESTFTWSGVRMARVSGLGHLDLD
jgi:hypothetical protein